MCFLVSIVCFAYLGTPFGCVGFVCVVSLIFLGLCVLVVGCLAFVFVGLI